MYEANEHWKQYKQKKYPTMNDFLEMGYTKPGAMILDEMKEAEAKELAKQEMDKFLNKLTIKNGTTKY